MTASPAARRLTSRVGDESLAVKLRLSACAATLSAAILSLAVCAQTPSQQPAANGAASAIAGTGGAESSRLAALSPAGMSAQEACTGLQSVAECATALHLAHNLTIPFTDLRSRLTDGQSLAAALQAVKPDADVKSEVRRAERQARADARAPQG